MALLPGGGTHQAVDTKAASSNTFTKLETELSTALEVQLVPIQPSQQSSSSLQKQFERKLLRRSGDNGTKRPYLPGQPRIKLDGPQDGSESDELYKYLRKSHLTQELDRLLPFMKYIFVQTPSYRHIMPLHHQKAHAREVVVSESPGIHLVWYYEKIFVKPLPAYFYSQAFWDYLEASDTDVYRAAVGFMRSYYFLIQYEIDFELACEKKLIPRKCDGALPSYEEFCDFIGPFGTVLDASVSRRFHYGELRLTRINRTATLFGFSLAYFHIYPQWGSFLAHILAPVITVFAVASVVLNAMQVTLQAQGTDPSTISDSWMAFINASIWFPVIVIILIAGILAGALLGVLFMGMKDLIRGKTVRQKKKHGDHEAGEKSHGMVW